MRGYFAALSAGRSKILITKIYVVFHHTAISFLYFQIVFFTIFLE